jgi:multimeric flavodoxin WrbA
MAQIIALLASARPKGWTKQLFEAACEEAEKTPGVTVVRRNLHKAKIRPCLACFNCIRSEEHRCTQKDDMGGDGELFKEIEASNGMIIADPVFLWNASALTHLFIERMYPFIWSGKAIGLPFASISCASNSGFQFQASADIERQVFNFGFRYLGCVPVHASYFEEGLKAAREMGKKMAEAALEDEKERKSLTDKEKFAMYSWPWNVMEGYMDNLTNGSRKPEEIMPKRAIDNEIFTHENALEVLEPAKEKLLKMFEAMEAGNIEEAQALMSDGSALWTEATWREFLQDDVIGVTKPESYRPVDNL